MKRDSNRIVLPAWNAVTGRYIDPKGEYKAYSAWRKSEGYRIWLRRQWAKQNGCCFYCNESLVGRRHNVEHVLSISSGGGTTTKNLVLSCPACNKSKGNKKVSRSIKRAAAQLSMQRKKPVHWRDNTPEAKAMRTNAYMDKEMMARIEREP